MVAILLAVVEQLPFWSAAWPVIIFFLTLSFGPALVSLRALGRHLTGRSGRTKTPREPIPSGG